MLRRKKIKITSLKEDDLLQIYKIVREYPEDFSFRDIEDMKSYLNEQIDIKVGIKDNEIIGFGFLEALNEMEGYTNGIVALYIAKNKFSPHVFKILKRMINYYIRKHNLFILSAVARANNFMCIKLLKKLGFGYFKVLKNFRGDLDYVMASIVGKELAEPKRSGRGGAVRPLAELRSCQL